MFALCGKYASARFSGFLDGGEAADIRENARFPYGYNVMFWGGFEGAERTVMGVFPEWEEAAEDKFPISAVKFTHGFSKKLTHRDYLGTVMSLGIDRAKTGDILINGSEAYVFAASDIAEYIAGNISKVGNVGVKAEVLSAAGADIPQRTYRTEERICASLRLDAVVSGVLKVSRAESAGLIGAGKVKLNFRETSNVSASVKEGDLVSVRGYGRFTVGEAGGETRKGRARITVKFYE